MGYSLIVIYNDLKCSSIETSHLYSKQYIYLLWSYQLLTFRISQVSKQAIRSGIWVYTIRKIRFWFKFG